MTEPERRLSAIKITWDEENRPVILVEFDYPDETVVPEPRTMQIKRTDASAKKKTAYRKPGNG